MGKMSDQRSSSTRDTIVAQRKNTVTVPLILNYCLNPLALVLLALNLTYHSSSSFRQVAPPLPQPVSWLDRNRSWSMDPRGSRAEEADSGLPLSSPSKRSACSRHSPPQNHMLTLCHHRC
ncbi:hypothetical protein HN51_039150 [Arachis hypogaea]